MSLMSIMPRTLNFGVERAEQRAQVASLGMNAPTAQQATATVAADGTAATAQATLGADGVQPVTPPQPIKTILGSMVRGAVQGASMAFGLNWAAGAFPPVAGFLGKILSFIPFIPKVSFPVGTLVALGAGAAVGAVFGLISGVAKSRKEAAAFQAAQAAEAQGPTPVGQPMVVGPDGRPVALNPATGQPAGSASPADAAAARVRARTSRRARRNPVMGKGFKAHAAGKKSRSGRGGGSEATHHIVWGDTLSALSRRYGVSIDTIVKANRDKIKDPNLIYAGDSIVIPA